MLAFDGEPLFDAAREVTWHTGVRFEFVDPSLREVRVGGYIRANDLGAFLQLLHQNFQIKSEPLEKSRVQLRRIA